MKIIRKNLLIFLCVTTTFAVHANTALHNVSDLRLLQAACPKNWSSIDMAIPSNASQPTPPTTITWENTADKDDFMLFQSNFIVKSTLNGQTRESKATDPLLVASECLKRHNPVLNAYMGKEIGEPPLLRRLINMVPILWHILFGDE